MTLGSVSGTGGWHVTPDVMRSVELMTDLRVSCCFEDSRTIRLLPDGSLAEADVRILRSPNLFTSQSVATLAGEQVEVSHESMTVSESVPRRC